MKTSALVFGATGGIGQLIVRHLSGQGLDVTAAARSAVPQDAGIYSIAADVADAVQVARAFDLHLEKWGSVPEAVVNAAALQGPIGPFWEIDGQEWEKTVDIDLTGSFRVLAETTRRMKSRGSGSIFLFSGGGAVYARPNFSAYAAAKAGVLRLAENAADELAAAGMAGIRVFAVAPGAVRSRMTAEVLAAADKAGDKAAREAEATMESGGTAAEAITRLLDFLRSEAGAGLSGRLIHVREDYLSYSGKAMSAIPAETGKLRRIPL